MKQVLQNPRNGEIAVEDVPAPQVLPGCVLVRVAASVVSAGTERASAEFARKGLLQKAQSRPDLVRDVIQKVQRDGILSALQSVRSRLDQPQTPGYSSAGTVLALGSGVADLRPGDRVACAGAGFAVHAELASVPRLLMARIPAGEPQDISLEEAAFATLGAVALHGIRTAEAKIGDTVAVIGLGLLGQLTVQLLRAAGCRVLGMDIDGARADLARRMGAEAAATSSDEFRDLCFQSSHGVGVDSVLITAETSSSEPVNLAGAIARERAIVAAVGTVGMDIERKLYYEKELDFRVSRSYGPGRYDAAYEQKGRDYPIGYVRWSENRNMESFLQLLAERKVNVGALITHRFPIERARAAYELIMGRSRGPFLGVVIHYSETADAGRTLTLVKSAPPELDGPKAASPDVSVGLLGAGVFACNTLLPALKASSGTILIGVCAAKGSSAQHAAKKFGFHYCTTNESQILQDSNVNTVVAATRHHLHASQVLAAISAGKNVFCEKPLCLSEDELRLIVRAYLDPSMTRRPALMVGFNRRFAPMIVRLRKFLSPIAEPLSLSCRVNAGSLPRDHWVNDREQGGGRILGEVCHFVDLLMFLAGSQIVEVEARPIGNSSRYAGDNVIVSLRFAGGSEGTIHYLANGDRSFSKERIEVFGGGSAAVLDDFRSLELSRHGLKQTLRSRWRQDKGHEFEWAAFVQWVEGKREAPIRFDDLVCSTLATLRTDQSAATGKSMAVDTAAFIDSALESSSCDE